MGLHGWWPCVALMLLGCGSTPVSLGQANSPSRDAEVAKLHVIQQIDLPGNPVIKVRSTPDGTLLALTEKFARNTLVTRPARQLLVFGVGGESASIEPPPGWWLIDFAVHSGGDITTILASDADDIVQYRIQRQHADGSTLIYTMDDLSAARSLPIGSLDMARVLPDGDDDVVVARCGDGTLWAQRLTYVPDLYRQAWRTLVEPDGDLLVSGIAGGGVDTFAQGDYAVTVRADLDGQANLYVTTGIGPTLAKSSSNLLAAHNATFGDSLPTDDGRVTAILSKLSHNGTRLYSRALGSTTDREEVLGVRNHADGSGVMAFGRTKTANSWEGWDALWGRLDGAGTATATQHLDFDAGDALFDACSAPHQRVVAVGCTHYGENPHGVSVTEERDALAAILDANGAIVQRLPLHQGPRGNEARSVWPLANGSVLIAGMTNAPGTHSTDLHADGFITVWQP